MLKRLKRRSHSQPAAARRWSNTNVSDSNDSSSDEYSMDIDGQELTLSEKLSLAALVTLLKYVSQNVVFSISVYCFICY